jgi:hypothetical protein
MAPKGEPRGHDGEAETVVDAVDVHGSLRVPQSNGESTFC